MSKISLPTRIAWRSIRRAPGRSGAIVAALAVPLAAVLVVATAQATGSPSPAQQLAEMIGTAEGVLLNTDFTDTSVASTLADGPPDAVEGPAAAEVLGEVGISAGDRQVAPRVYGLELNDQLHAGRLHLSSGRAPTGPDEIALSASAAGRLDARPGGQVFVGSERRRMSVTGVAVQRRDTTEQFVIMAPMSAAEILDADAVVRDRPDLLTGRDVTQLAWYTATAPPTADLTANGWVVETRAHAEDLVTQSASTARNEALPLVSGIALLVLFEAALVIWAVFVIVVRRNRRNLAVLAAAGAPTAVQRRIVISEGRILGLLAVATGAAIGVVGGALGASVVAHARAQLPGPLTVPWLVLAGVVVVGLTLPTVAARLAAGTIGTDVVRALADRPDLRAPRRRRGMRRWVQGALLGVAATALFLGVSGSTVTFIAVGAMLLIAVAATITASRLPELADVVRSTLPGTLGTRLVGRAPSRSTALATVLSSLTVVAGIILVGASGMAAQAAATYQPRLPDGAGLIEATRAPSQRALTEMAEDLDGREPIVLGTLTTTPPLARDGEALTFWGEYDAEIPAGTCTPAVKAEPGAAPPAFCAHAPMGRASVKVVDERHLDQVIGRPLTNAERDHASDGGALVLDARLVTDGQVQLTHPSRDAEAPIRQSVPAIVVKDRLPFNGLPAVLLAPTAVDLLDAFVQPRMASLYIPAGDTPITTEQEDRSRASLSRDISAGYFHYEVERGSAAVTVLRRLLLIAAGTLLLVVVALTNIGVTLATTDLRPDLTALSAAGASPRARSALNAHHAGLVTALGVATGVVITVVTSPFLLTALHAPPTLLPWAALAGLAVATVGAATVTGLIAGRRTDSPLRRSR